MAPQVGRHEESIAPDLRMRNVFRQIRTRGLRNSARFVQKPLSGWMRFSAVIGSGSVETALIGEMLKAGSNPVRVVLPRESSDRQRLPNNTASVYQCPRLSIIGESARES